MDTHNLKLSIFVYNKKMIQSLLQHIICSINDGHIQDSGITISKKWQKGPHIEVIIPGESSPDDKNAAFLRKAAEDFIGNNEIPQDESYEKYEKLSERVAILEGYKGSISPLNKHLEIVCEPFDWNSIDTIFPHDVYRDIEVTLSKFLFEAMPYYNSLSENDKMLFLTECMIILGNQREKQEELSGGIKYGYMTFQSPYQGFLAQLKGTPNEEMIKSVLTSDNRYVVDSLKSEMEELMRNEASAEHKNDKERILDIWRETVNHMLAKYEKSIEGNEISWNDSQNFCKAQISH